MFTGIIISTATLINKITKNDGVILSFKLKDITLDRMLVGESVAVNGCCLTIIEHDKTEFSVFLSDETLRLTNLTLLNINDMVNIELPLTLGSFLGGHMVTGHVDAIGEVKKITQGENTTTLAIDVPKHLLKFVAIKGSITVNGVSLTINSVTQNIITIKLIPQTLKSTNLSLLKANDEVNLEVDLVARYLHRFYEETKVVQYEH